MATPDHIRRTRACLAALVIAVAVGARPASAQDDPLNAAHWGASFSFTPSWDLAPQLKKLIQDESTSVGIQGSEFSVGLVRGSRRGGDWGVSFISKPFKDGSSFVATDEACFQTSCLPTKETNVMQNVKLTGIEIHKFIRIANITNAAQIGVNVGGGIAKVSGTVVRTRDDYETNFNPQTGRVNVVPTHTVETKDAAQELFPKFPLMKLELEGAAVISPALKATIAGGFNFPGVGMRVGLVYLFGAH